jgi:hypothetical protein
MTDIDCPYGVTGVTKEEDQHEGRCVRDNKSCWNSVCNIGCWKSCKCHDKSCKCTAETCEGDNI